MLVDGKLRPAADGAEFDNVSPATGRVLGVTAAAGPTDMDGAIENVRCLHRVCSLSLVLLRACSDRDTQMRLIVHNSEPPSTDQTWPVTKLARSDAR